MPRCFAISNPQFQYAMRLITNITTADPCVITTSFDHGYISGLQVRISVPRQYGIEQIDEQAGFITVLTPTSFSIDIDSSAFDPYIAAPPVTWRLKSCPYVVPITGVTDNILGQNNSIS